MLPIRRLTQPSDTEIDRLSAVLIDCVEGGASVSFMHPLSPAKARAFWQQVAQDVARGARAGILGTRDAMDTPFSAISYTNELILDRHARSVGDVLQNDPTVRVARGFGNFQESYFIRGFLLDSDDTAFNGLYSLLPRQYIATELFERVEVLRGASAFLNGASPAGGGIGGSTQLAADIARRFGPDGNTGVRLNAATHNGGTMGGRLDMGDVACFPEAMCARIPVVGALRACHTNADCPANARRCCNVSGMGFGGFMVPSGLPRVCAPFCPGG